TGVSPDNPVACTSARSWVVSVATTFAGTVLPLDNRTLTVPSAAITWLLVRIRPFEPITTPEPSDDDRAPSTMTVTTLGCTAATTLAKLSPPVTVADVLVATVPLVVVVVRWSARYRSASTPPAVPPPATSASTVAPPAIRRGQCRPPGAGGMVDGGAGGGGGIVRSCRSPAYASSLGDGGRVIRSVMATPRFCVLMTPQFPGKLSVTG